VIALYAIADHPGPALPDVAALRAVPAGRLEVICATAEDRPVSADELWRHEEVVEAIMEDRDLLPVRYGTHVSDEAAAARAVEERHEDLADALDRVRGAVELSLRVIAPEAPSGDAGSGAEYLRAKASSAAAQEGAIHDVHEPLTRLARAKVRRAAREPGELLRAAYLVDREAVEPFTAAVARLQAAHPHLRLLCTGPWPPYSFAGP
jgi:Gas vesicle synthesis protein GvpL/GvpF